MADQFLSLAATPEASAGFLDDASFRTGTSSTSADVIELRWTIGSVTRKDILLALEAFEKVIVAGGLSNSDGTSVPAL